LVGVGAIPRIFDVSSVSLWKNSDENDKIRTQNMDDDDDDVGSLNFLCCAAREYQAYNALPVSIP